MRAPGVHTLFENVVLHVVQADSPGPTALIQAGIHGDEIAGVHAIEELIEAGYRPHRGRLLLVPVMNPPAYRARTRAAPQGQDLNRSFPGNASSSVREERLAAAFMDLVHTEAPALVATLHESKSRHDPAVHPSFGQTLVYGVEPCPPWVSAAVDRLNQYDDVGTERWATFHYPVATSSTEVIVDRFGCVGTCVETWMGLPEARRVVWQRRVVDALLVMAGLRDEETS